MTDSFKEKCAIVGIGNTAYTRGTDKTTMQLHLEASMKAIEDAGLKTDDIDCVMPNEVAGTIAEDFIRNLGIRDLRYTSTIRTGGASFVTAIQSACMTVSSGTANYALLVAGRLGYSAARVSKAGTMAVMAPAPVTRDVDQFERPLGNSVVMQWFAQAATRHMHLYGTKSSHLGMIAVACRKHANLNPQAVMYGKPMTLEDHQKSPIFASPLRMLDSSLESDGAGAVIVTTVDRARALKKAPAYIMGIAEGHPMTPTSITQKPDMTDFEGIIHAGKHAFKMAGVTHKDIDCAQIYDGFTWVTLASLEGLGFCKKGEGGPFVEGGRIELGGQLPVNTAGGLVSEAHCSGVNHVIEAVRQLRREVEPARQVQNCETVLVTGAGDFHEGAVMIVRR